MASTPSQETALNLHHADEEHHGEDGKEEDPADLAVAPILPEEALSESPLLPARRSSQQRSCGKVGPARPSAEDRIMPTA